MKARIIFSLAAVLVLVGCAPVSYAPPPVDYFQRGNSHYEKGDYDLAIRDYTEAIHRNQNKAAAYANRGELHRIKSESDIAIADLTEAIRLEPKYAWAYGRRGIAYLNKGEYDSAIADLTEAMRLDLKVDWAYANRGTAYDHKGEYDSAIADLTEAIRLDPKWPYHHENRGEAYLHKGAYNTAIADLTEAIRLFPSRALASYAYVSRGEAYLNKGEYDSAIADLTEAIRLDPKKPSVHDVRGFVHLLRGQYDRAEADWRKAADLKSDTKKKAGSLENISLVYLKQGKWRTALAHTASVNALRDNLALNWLFRAIAAHQMGDDTNASSAYGKWSTLRKADDVQELAKYLPKRLHVYLDKLPSSMVTVRMMPTLVSWRAPRKTRILSVGVGDFKDTAIPSIDYAETDARSFASLAKSSGIPEENIIHLTSKDAYRNDITDALIKLKMATTDRSETAIFYFSGHGAPIVKNGKIVDAALVPYDARENSPEYTGIKISMLREMLSDTRGNWIVILDACFSGKEGRSLMAKNVKGIAVVPKKFNIVRRAKKSLWWMTATSGDNFANDFPKENHGLFTYYFLKALNGKKGVDANEDGLISMREAFSWTKEEVQAVSAKSLGRLQVPELIGEGDTILTIPR